MSAVHDGSSCGSETSSVSFLLSLGKCKHPIFAGDTLTTLSVQVPSQPLHCTQLRCVWFDLLKRPLAAHSVESSQPVLGHLPPEPTTRFRLGPELPRTLFWKPSSPPLCTSSSLNPDFGTLRISSCLISEVETLLPTSHRYLPVLHWF